MSAMRTLALVGSQWGDEGKGKITDYLGQRCDVVVRYQGGNNAGHTIIVDGKKIVLHLVPSGILHSRCLSLIGHGVALEPLAFWQEVEGLREAGLSLSSQNLQISSHCSVITSYHRLLDITREKTQVGKIGTTGKGIGPCYQDKVGRYGLTCADLLHKKKLLKKLELSLREKETLFTDFYAVNFPSVQEEGEALFELGQKLAPFMSDTFGVIHRSYAEGKKILYEGAQGVLLDIDYGSYPFVTSSSTGLGGVLTGAGLPGGAIDGVLGISKAYTTRVGLGPFPTELCDSLGESIQQKGQEFGATTGRSRRCGWIDLPLLRYAIKASAISSLALSKIDILSGLPELKVCHAYWEEGDEKGEGREITCAYPGIDLGKVRPLYQELRPFKDELGEGGRTGRLGRLGRLSAELEKFIEIIETAAGIPVGILAYGPERDQILMRRQYF